METPELLVETLVKVKLNSEAVPAAAGAKELLVISNELAVVAEEASVKVVPSSDKTELPTVDPEVNLVNRLLVPDPVIPEEALFNCCQVLEAVQPLNVASVALK